MKIFTILISLFLISAAARPRVVPHPERIDWSQGTWQIPASGVICYVRNAQIPARWLKQLLSPISKVEPVRSKHCKGKPFSIILEPKLKNLGEEGYRLKINDHGVTLTGATHAGLFYAIQTLRQLLPAEIEASKALKNVPLPHVNIEDVPAYSWRGSMLDVARSFYGVEYIKHHIERMALFKLNRLHLHLTDDQGWRIEIQSYPNLAHHGGSDAVTNGSPGHFTQLQYREIQEYARARNIIVIPEIEMPGHSYAALASYPELNCANLENISPRLATPPELYHGVRVKWNSLCIEKPEVKTFVSAVLQEIAANTLGPWIHIGGDEVDVENYSQFIHFVDSEVRRFGKTALGWEEILSTNSAKNMISQIYTMETFPMASPIVISLCNHFYFDHSNVPAQNLPNDWCQRDGVSLEDTYRFTAPKNHKNILGIEASVWTEFANNISELDHRLWPRLVAASEVSWSRESQREISDFRKRLAPLGKRFDLMGINFFKTPGIDWIRNSKTNPASSIFFDFNP